MQAVVWLPGVKGPEGKIETKRSLLRKVSGIPLLVRTLATASRAGVSEALIVYPEGLDEALLKQAAQAPILSGLNLQTRKVPEDSSGEKGDDWKLVEADLKEKFLWLPWNFVTLKKSLRLLLQSSLDSADGAWLCPVELGEVTAPAGATPPLTVEQPILVKTESLIRTGRGDLLQFLRQQPTIAVATPSPAGVVVNSRASVREAEDLLVRGSGKPGDGFYSKVNRRMTWPVVRPLMRTPVTANMVTWAGLPVAALSGWFYAQGGYLNFVLGGIAYFIAVLIDEMDGMIARTKFEESAFGCWLETFSDYMSYLFLWAGITIGLYRESGNPVWLYLGALTFFGGITTFLVLVRLRKVSAPPDQPEQHLQNFYSGLEQDSANWISKITRKVHFVMRKGVMCHYLLLFSLLGIIKYFFLITAFGSNVAWILGLYFTRRLFSTPVRGEG